MKRYCPHSCIYTICIYTLFAISPACKNQSVNADEELPPIYPEPRIIPYNIDGGYVTNQLTGDSIFPLMNKIGDTVKSGVRLLIKGQVIRRDTGGTEWRQFSDFNNYPVDKITKKPKRDKEGWIIPTDIARPPRSVPVSNLKQEPFLDEEKYVPSDLRKNIVDESSLKKFTIGIDTGIQVIHHNSVGKVIPTGKAFRVHGKVVPCKFPPIIPSGIARFRDNARYDIQYLDIEEGMKASNCFQMIQDKRGYLWIGQTKGVSRYDGASFIHFTSKEGFTDEPPNAIVEDKKGNLWFSFRNRIICYNGSTFTHYTDSEGLPTYGIRHMISDNNGILWLATLSGLMRFEPDTNSAAKVILFSKQEGLLEAQVNFICLTKTGSLWFGSPHFLYRFEPTKNGEEGVITYFAGKKGFLDRGVSTIMEDSHGNIWFGEVASGLSRYEPPSKGDIGLITRFTRHEGFSDKQVKDLFEDREGNIWIGTLGDGIYKYSQKNINGEIIESFRHYSEENGLVGENCHPELEDNSGNLWITSSNGMYRLVHNSFSLMDDYRGLLKDITEVSEDKQHNFWIGTWGNGFYKLENQGNQNRALITYYLLESDSTTNLNNFINCIFEDSRGNIWFGTRWALALLQTKTGKDEVLTYFYYENGIRGASRKILEDKSGKLWIATSGGIEIFDYSDNPGDGIFTVYSVYASGLPSSDAYDMIQDHKGSIWTATPKGLIRFQSMNKYPEVEATFITEKEGLSSNSVQALCEDINGWIWIGTSSGLNIFKPSQNGDSAQIIYYTDKEGLSGNNIQSIIQGSQINGESTIWVKTENDMDLFRVKSGHVKPVKLCSIGKSDGLDLNMLLGMSRDPKGNLFFNLRNGVAKLNSLSFEVSSTVPKPQLHAIEINDVYEDFRAWNDSVTNEMEFDSVVNFENYPLHLQLPYKKNHLAFHYSALDLAAPYKIRYSYKMEGLEDAWSKLTHETKAEYRNLPSGTHTFKVRAIGESQQWSEPFEYKFTIRPPWWSTWWAYIMYGFLGGFVLYRTHRFQVNRKLEIAEKNRMVELDRVKNRLYTNITHEFRTPLTLIHGPVSQAMTKNSTLDQKDIQSIYRQSERLQQLINQMLALQKLEAGMLKPNYSYGEIIQTLRYLVGSFETWAAEKNISLIFSSSLQEVYMDFDKEKLTQIISNLISNAIKHTPNSGKVAMLLSTSSSGDYLLINITDTGVGISQEDLPYIFDRFYQSKKAATGGTGIGLALVKNLTELLGGNITVESKVDIGSTFRLALPITKHAPILIETAATPKTLNEEASDEEINQEPASKPIILIVEDHPEVLKYIVSCLASEFATMVATNGDEGIRLANEHIPDLIISDVMMPGKDGFELCTILKTNILTSHIPIILLTGRGDHEAMMIGIEHGADAYVVKPFDPDELLLRVKKLLELRATLSQYYRRHSTTSNLESVATSSPKENEFLKNIRVFVEEHINDSQFNMNMLCQHMAISHPQLHRKITALTGESTGKFVRSIRLGKAVELLKNSDLTVSEIAYETGFSEPGYFTKVFSKEYNLSPTEYRDMK